MSYLAIKLTLAVFATFGLYSVLYRETRFYRFFEHIYLGLAAGYTLVATWKDTLYTEWWIKMLGKTDVSADGVATVASNGFWIYSILAPIGLMGYMVFSKKHNWMSKIPIGIILGIWSGQQLEVWWNTYGPQIYSSALPVIPTTWSFVPAQPVAGELYASQALTNAIFIFTLISAFSYFLFSFELKGKFLTGLNTMGRWMLMIGFGAIFGSTVMARFALVIDRMSYIWNEWLQGAILGGS
ncbi:MAG: hypothetical protein KDC26_07350 [Armatimonadetes bacterium]|nr:hypothetical protein [Armatimonadota bacterium]